mgnify:CR=1 FL=1
MSNHENPISLNSGNGNLAKAIVSQKEGHWSVPEGTILASRVDRLAAFVLDVVVITTILLFITKGKIYYAWNISMWLSTDIHYSIMMAFVIFGSHWLYWRYSGIYLSRSLGQKLFGLAVVADDGSEMTSKMWEIRALKKLGYLIFPFSIYFGSYDLARISQRHTHQSNIDLRVGSIVAHANSLPPANRKHIK